MGVPTPAKRTKTLCCTTDQNHILRTLVLKAVLFPQGCDQVTDTEANLLANTRLIAPIRVGWGPNVEAMMRVEGRPRHMLVSTARLRSSEMTDQARTIGPPTITAWGAKP